MTELKRQKTGGKQKGYRTPEDILLARRQARLGQPCKPRGKNPHGYRIKHMSELIKSADFLIARLEHRDRAPARRFWKLVMDYVKQDDYLALSSDTATTVDSIDNATADSYEPRRKAITFRGKSIE